jgi:photosystem II stability/assembly factor-like uncharacterized protein
MTKCTTAGIYRSSASGAAGTFAKLGDLVREPVPGPGRPIGRTAVAVAPSDANVVWALAADASSNRLIGAFRSNDGGVSWRRARTPRMFCGAAREPGQCFYDLTVAIDPTDSSKAFAGGIWVYGYRSVEQRPTRLGAGLSGIHSDQHAATIDSLGRLWVGNDGGVYRSDNGGDTFADLNAQLSITQFNSGIAGSLALLVGGTQDNGFVHYEGGKWSAFAAFGDGGASALDPAHPKVIYGTYVNGLVRRSLNGGKDEFPPVFQAPSASEFYAPLLMDPTDSDRVYLGTDRLWRGSHRGRHWERVAGPFDQTMTAIGLTPASDQVAYVAPRGELIVTRDGFDTATNTQPNGLPYRIFSDIAVQSDDAGTAYVTVCGFASGHVFRTSDFGAHWTDISGNLPDSPANAIAVDETTFPHTLYVGSDLGVYASADAGASWQRAGDMPIVVVTDLLIDKQSDELIAATHGRGVLATQIPRGD